jgi:hypothetical protein
VKNTSCPVTVADEQSYADEIARLNAALADARLLSANRLAAIRAALAAADDGETDPLAYLRDQLTEESIIPGARSGL